MLRTRSGCRTRRSCLHSFAYRRTNHHTRTCHRDTHMRPMRTLDLSGMCARTHHSLPHRLPQKCRRPRTCGSARGTRPRTRRLRSSDLTDTLFRMLRSWRCHFAYQRTENRTRKAQAGTRMYRPCTFVPRDTRHRSRRSWPGRSAPSRTRSRRESVKRGMMPWHRQRRKHRQAVTCPDIRSRHRMRSAP